MALAAFIKNPSKEAARADNISCQFKALLVLFWDWVYFNHAWHLYHTLWIIWIRQGDNLNAAPANMRKVAFRCLHFQQEARHDAAILPACFQHIHGNLENVVAMAGRHALDSHDDFGTQIIQVRRCLGRKYARIGHITLVCICKRNVGVIVVGHRGLALLKEDNVNPTTPIQ